MDNAAFAELCRRQYVATLAMLRQSMMACPPELWSASDGQEAPFWRHAMHAIFYARLYLCEGIGRSDDKDHAERMMRLVGNEMKDWSGPEVNRLGATMGGMTNVNCVLPRTPSQEELLEALAEAEGLADRSFSRLASGEVSPDARNPMPWMSGSRADLLLYNLRHIQHHIGRLNSMLGRRSKARLSWIGGMP